jgi:hypothetical protein
VVPSGARGGTLAVFAGGEAEDVQRARPVLMSFAGRVTHMGASGSGMAGKICNQMLSFATGTVIAETLNLAARFGMDPGVAAEGNCRRLRRLQRDAALRPPMIEAPTAATRDRVKDMDIAVDLARLTGSPIPMTASCPRVPAGARARLHRRRPRRTDASLFAGAAGARPQTSEDTNEHPRRAPTRSSTSSSSARRRRPGHRGAAKKMGLDVLLLEKDSVYGGTTARSGGVLWIPNNPISTFKPEPDSMEAARTYLKYECGEFYDEARVGSVPGQRPAHGRVLPEGNRDRS